MRRHIKMKEKNQLTLEELLQSNLGFSLTEASCGIEVHGVCIDREHSRWARVSDPVAALSNGNSGVAKVSSACHPEP